MKRLELDQSKSNSQVRIASGNLEVGGSREDSAGVNGTADGGHAFAGSVEALEPFRG